MGWSSDDRLLIRAIREGWNVPGHKLPGIIEHVAAIAAGDGTVPPTPRESTAAMKALLSAAKLQLETIKVELAVEEREQLRERIRVLEGRTDEQPHDASAPPRADPPVGPDGDGRTDGPAPA